MKYILFFLISNLIFSNAIYYLYLHKCNPNSDFTIEFLRKQYDDKHYPIYCNKNYEYNNIKYMKYNLNHDFIDCDNKKNNLNYLENIWNLYGSCTDLDNYNYFNKSLVLFYNYSKLLNHYNCKHDKHCIIKYNDKYEVL